ncbi:hypothetical protein [Deinococcus navajonensis]|uniref:Uncharacterized protein n=1 Tax=Deinococcus navajonensis TaxID=309884 RepID=A0ABV8XSU8_9DEIO
MTILPSPHLDQRLLAPADLPVVLGYRHDADGARFQQGPEPVILKPVHGWVSGAPRGRPGQVKRAVVMDSTVLGDLTRSTPVRQTGLRKALSHAAQDLSAARALVQVLPAHASGSVRRGYDSSSPRIKAVSGSLRWLGFRYRGIRRVSDGQCGPWTDGARCGLTSSEWTP